MQNIAYQPEQVVDCNGIQLNYDSYGDPSDPPILLIMGLATQMIYWDETLCKMLASCGFWVIRFDNRDVGKSTWLESHGKPSYLKIISNGLFKRPIGASYLLKDMVEDTLGLTNSLGIQQAHLVGASMGGMIAQALAINNADRVLSLTSIMSTTGDRSLPKASLGFSLKVMSPPPKEPAAMLPHALNVWRSLHGKHFSFEQQRVTDLITRAMKRGINLAGGARQLAAILDSPDRTADLKKLQIPSLVIHGESDPLIPVECGVATADAIPNAQLKIYQGMGHTLPTELYEDICDIMTTHMQKAT